MNEFSFPGSVAVVTGGTGAIGSTIARALVSVGVKTVILGRDRAKAERFATEISRECGGVCVGYAADVLSRDALMQVRTAISQSIGPVSMLVNCAGGNSPKATTKREALDLSAANDFQSTFFGLDIDGFDEVFDLNVKGTILPCMVFAQDMAAARSGSIITVSSMTAFRPLTKIPAYSAAKASINNFTQWLAVHFAPVNVRVNGVSPGFFLTDQNRFLLLDEKSGQPTQRAQKILAHTPMGRFGDPREVADAALFLLSDAARFITGVVLPVDGGFSAYCGV